MDKNEETFASWNKVAKLYEEKFMDINLYNESYDLFCNTLIKEHSFVLDVACGPGSITKYLLNKMPGLAVDAIDIAPNMISLAKVNCPTANCWVMDCREINQLPKKYDGIISGFGLPYLSAIECEKFMADATALLNSHGLLYISFVEGSYAESGFRTGSTGDRTYFYFHNMENMIDKLKENGFEQIKVLNRNYSYIKGTAEIHCMIISQKIG